MHNRFLNIGALFTFLLCCLYRGLPSASAEDLRAYECRAERLRLASPLPDGSYFAPCKTCVQLQLILEGCKVLSWFGTTGGSPHSPWFHQVSPLNDVRQLRSPIPPHSTASFAEKQFRIPTSVPGGTSPRVTETFSFLCPHAEDASKRISLSVIHEVKPRLDPDPELAIAEYYLNCSYLDEAKRLPVLERYRRAMAARQTEGQPHEVDWSLLSGVDILDQAPSDSAPALRLQEDLRALLARNASFSKRAVDLELGALAGAGGLAYLLGRSAAGRFASPARALALGLGVLGFEAGDRPALAIPQANDADLLLFHHFRSERGLEEFTLLPSESAARILERSPSLQRYLEAIVRR